MGAPPAGAAQATAYDAELESGPLAETDAALTNTKLSSASEVAQVGKARSPSVTRAKAAPPAAEPKPDTSAAVAGAERAPTASSASGQRAPLLIYTATVTLAVFGLDPALAAVEELARAHQGYLVRRSDTSITVRVPAAMFQDALAGVGKLGDELHRDVNARDVTEEYTDLEIRLRNAEAVRERLETLLAKTSKVDEALSVERELARVTGSIEELKGKLKLLSELVAFSTITVNFQPRGVEHLNPEHSLPFDWLKELGLSNLLAL